MHVDHLEGGEFLQGGPRGQSRGQGPQAGLEGDLETLGEKGDEEMGVDTLVELVVDRA
jgi:hypothetical protein